MMRITSTTAIAIVALGIAINRCVELHAEEFPTGFDPRFTGSDVAAKDVVRRRWRRGDSRPDGAKAAASAAANLSNEAPLAVEFTDMPRAYSILAYGESDRADSPFHDDQAAMFARGQLKKVAFTPRDVEAATIRRYRPGVSR